MGMIGDVETEIIAQVQTVLGSVVRKVESVPGGWTMDMLTRALQFAPGVYCSFLGAAAETDEGYHAGRFAVYLVTKGASESDRRLGNARVIGAYDMVERLLPAFDGLDLPGIGRMRVRSVENLFRDALFDLGGTVYAMTLALPNMPFTALADESGLDDFLRFHVDYDIDQDGRVDATDDIELRS